MLYTAPKINDQIKGRGKKGRTKVREKGKNRYFLQSISTTLYTSPKINDQIKERGKRRKEQK